MTRSGPWFTHMDEDVRSLKSQVAKLERQVEFILGLLDQSQQDFDEPEDSGLEQYIELVRNGQNFEAIQLYRRETGADLKTAKDFVDSLIK